MARKKFYKTDEQSHVVYKAASLGIKVLDIMKLVGLNNNISFKDHFGEEYDKGFSEAKTKVAAKLMDKIEEGCLTAIIFFLKTRCGWKDPERGEFPIESSLPSNGAMTASDIIKFREIVIKKVADGEISPSDALSVSSLLRDQDTSIERLDIEGLRGDIGIIKDKLNHKKT